MRGKENERIMQSKPIGITPAYAGKSSPAAARACIMRDHPRLCGEKFWAAVMPSMLEGSPPPMRGKVSSADFPTAAPGITPAYAGKSFCRSEVFHASEDHPRLCGEKPTTAAPATRRAGSPPPMRGKDQRSQLLFLPSRITPAYAGKSSERRSKENKSKDHPRLCGEKSLNL